MEYKFNEKLIYRAADEIVFDTGKGVLIELNETGNKIVSLIINGYSVAEIINSFSKEYPDSTIDEIRIMVEEFITQAVQEGVLIETVK